MLHTYRWVIPAVAIGVVLVIRPFAADDIRGQDKEKAKSAEKEGAAPATVKVEKGPLTSAVVLKGIAESQEATELSVRFKTWTGPLIAQKAVEHGTAVKAGDTLVEFKAEKLDQAIRDSREERDLAQVAIRQAEQELPILEKQVPLDVAAAEREFNQAVEDLKRFVEVGRKMAVDSAEFTLKSANFNSEYARDELKQLQKMYNDKDLTEETERMILKRYKFSVESSDLRAAQAKIQTEFTLKVDLPRREQAAKSAVEKAEVALVKARDVQPLVVQQKRLALARLKYEEAKAKEHLAELELDRAALTVKSPVDGLAYHGRFVKGQLISPVGSQGPALLGVGAINSGDVFLTVVDAGKVGVRAETDEKELAGLKPGLTGRLAPTAFPNRKLPCEVVRVAVAPRDGKFEVRIKLDDKAEGFVPGMTCSARIVTAHKKTALTAPSSAVFEDAAEDIHYVYLLTKGGKPAKKTVKIGITSGDRIEIVEGLSEGDEIRASKP